MRLTSRPGPGLGVSGLIATLLLILNRSAVAYQLDPNSTDSVLSIAKDIAEDMVDMYHGDEPGQTPGLLPEPYYWWYAGAMLGTLVDYWAYTGDDQYVDITKQALLFQVGNDNDYMPINQTRTEGNDDQGFWGLTVMSAAEFNFPHPDPEEPQWLALAQAVFNTQAARWDTEHCGGGLRWQIFQNSISQACFFALGARLALFTGNDSYADWAEETWDWMEKIEFIDPQSWYVYDGAHIENQCSELVPYQFSYNAGGFILGAAAMYNYTESEVWKNRLDKLLEGAKIFFTGPERNIMTEVACEPVKLCNLDQKSFKAYLSRWLAVTTQWAPHTHDIIMPLLRTSAVAATKICTGGSNKRMCGLYWNKDKFEGDVSVGQQMAALEVTLSCLIKDRPAPLTKNTGGTSKGDPGGGSADIGRTTPEPDWKAISAGEKAGASILTIVVLCCLIASMLWIFLDETTDGGLVDQLRGFPSWTIAAVAALASGGGAAVFQRRKGEKNAVNEKSGALFKETSDSSSRGSGDKNAATAFPPIFVSSVRNQNPGHHRRVSSMPLGWPHNRSMRGSIIGDPDGIHPVSARQSRGDWANGGPGESSNTPEGSNEGSGGNTLQEVPVGDAVSMSEETSRSYEENGKDPTTTEFTSERGNTPVGEEEMRPTDGINPTRRDKPSSVESIGLAQ
ncbi:hypothetical protein FZEAL_7083 [Fusarium zealandicum]|uniref:mannan endo-1,6-alpha-mannosidase n=1 Tax=Fusarium zealandicum TaxID=1053134 RepID=A0A8H4UHC6_9HYPO|nr:hypothetical protein FZEAL_7083 [Fusarium zealandicum]